MLTLNKKLLQVKHLSFWEFVLYSIKVASIGKTPFEFNIYGENNYASRSSDRCYSYLCVLASGEMAEEVPWLVAEAKHDLGKA